MQVEGPDSGLFLPRGGPWLGSRGSAGFGVLALDESGGGRDAGGMKAIGLCPTAARLDLEPCELPILIEELLLRIETCTGSLREEQERSGHPASSGQLQAASNWILEYRNLLATVSGDDARTAGGSVSVTTPMLIAEQLARACVGSAIEQLAKLIDDRGAAREKLGSGVATVSAWVATLADLRYLDAAAPEAIAL